MSTATAHSKNSGRTARSRWGRILLVTLLVIAALVLLIRFVASPIVTGVVNKKLVALDGFTGRVEAIRIQPWRAGVEIKNLVLHERGFENDPPLVSVEKARFSAALAGLLRGKLGGDGARLRPRHRAGGAGAELRADARFDGTVLVALTGFGGVVDEGKARASGFDTRFRKPMDFDVLDQLKRQKPADA